MLQLPSKGVGAIAICSPGILISVPILFERITLFPEYEPKDASDVDLRREEVYDFLIRAEDQEVRSLLCLTPQLLFRMEEPNATLNEHVRSASLFDRSIGVWHHASQPHFDGTHLTASFHTVIGQRARPSVTSLKGSIGLTTIRFPQQLESSDAIGVLHSLKRTIFEVELDPPIRIGEQRWLRLCINPAHAFSSVPSNNLDNPAHHEPGINCSVLLDVFGADTLMVSFRDHLTNMLAYSQSSEIKADSETNQNIVYGCTKLFNFLFPNGFERQGTYTRIEEQRILLVPQKCQLESKTHDGAINFKGMTAVKANGEDLPAYVWVGGALEFPEHDPVTGAIRLLDYVSHFAVSEQAAKSKTELAVATHTDFDLCCRVVDELKLQNYLAQVGEKYFSGKDRLPKEESYRWMVLISITSAIARKFIILQAHFRVFFQASWWQLTQMHALHWEKRRKRERLLWIVSIAGLIVAITGAVLATLSLFISINK